MSHAIIISYRRNQLKLGALTMDALRLSQTLEWQPPSQAPSGPPACCPRCPRKIIFYQAPASRIQSALGATIDSMPPSKTLLVFIGADGWPFQCPAAAPKAANVPAFAPAPWSPTARHLADHGIALIAPLVAAHPESGSSMSAVAAASRHRRASAGFQDSSAEAPDPEGGSLSSTEPDNSLAPNSLLGGPADSSPTSLAAILPSVQAGPERRKRAPPRHCPHPPAPPSADDASSPSWPATTGPVLLGAPSATDALSTDALDAADAPPCASDTHERTDDADNDLEGGPLQDSAKARRQLRRAAAQ